MTTIKATIFNDAESFLTENITKFHVDNVSSVFPVKGDLQEGSVVYIDDYEETKKTKNMTDHVKALRKLVKLIDDKKLFVGGITSSSELTDPCNWDVEVADAFFQLVYHGEVIYG